MPARTLASTGAGCCATASSERCRLPARRSSARSFRSCQVRKIVGLGVPVNVGPKSDVLATFAETNDAPILFRQGHFFLIHPAGGIVAAYRNCTHLGCAVPWSPSEDRFHCPCHQSQYDKHTAVVLYGPAPKPLQLFHISDTDAGLVVDTNPLNVIDRRENRWDPSVIEIADTAG